MEYFRLTCANRSWTFDGLGKNENLKITFVCPLGFLEAEFFELKIFMTLSQENLYS